MEYSNILTISHNSERLQYIAIGGSIFIVWLILELIRKKKMKEEYALLWLVFGVTFCVLSVWRKGLLYIASLLGVIYAPAALFLISIIAIFAILIHYSIVISKLTEHNKTLVQEVGLLKWEITLLKKDIQHVQS